MGSNMRIVLLLFLGGGIGSICRYFLSSGIQDKVVNGFPLGTLVVNVLG